MIREIWNALKRWWSAPLDKIGALDLTAELNNANHGHSYAATLQEASTANKDEREYAVTGTPRHIPWNRRKKELEQAARQKRRHLESFQGEA